MSLKEDMAKKRAEEEMIMNAYAQNPEIETNGKCEHCATIRSELQSELAKAMQMSAEEQEALSKQIKL